MSSSPLLSEFSTVGAISYKMIGSLDRKKKKEIRKK